MTVLSLLLIVRLAERLVCARGNQPVPASSGGRAPQAGNTGWR